MKLLDSSDQLSHHQNIIYMICKCHIEICAKVSYHDMFITWSPCQDRAGSLSLSLRSSSDILKEASGLLPAVATKTDVLI